MTMTLKCETEFPKALKNIMLSMGMKGEAVYKGFPVIDEGQEYWWAYTRTKKTTTRRWDSGCSPTLRYIHHSLTPQDVLHGKL
jgi:hypothetical protein